MIVVDTNVIAYFWIPSPLTAEARRAFEKDSYWVAPPIWRSEFRNVLALSIRRKLMTLDSAIRRMEEAEEQFRRRTLSVASREVLTCVAESACSAYDCEFVALAKQLGQSLLSADRQLLAEYPAVAVSLPEFLER